MIRSTMVLALGVLGVMVSFPSVLMAAPAGDIEIWDGQSIEIKQAPYQIALFRNGKFICGGSLLGPDVVLTAAHCVPENITLDSKISMHAGSTYIEGPWGMVMNVKSGIWHPKYVATMAKKDYDVALLRLEHPMGFSVDMNPVKLATKDYEVNDGEMMVVSGWGKMRNGSLAKKLQMVELPKFNYEECKKIYAEHPKEVPPLTPNFLCAGTVEGGKNTCHGDSGGPLVHKGIQVGVVSGGSPQCAIPNFPANYTKVSAVRDWIDAFMKP